MAELKVVIGGKDGKSYQKEISADVASSFLGKRIGDKINGEVIDLTGYELQITGGSDKQGFPMRYDNQGIMRKRIMITGRSVGFKKNLSKGVRIIKSVAGNTISEQTAQVNIKVVKQGAQPLAKALGVEQPAEEAKAEAPKEEKKEAKAEKPKEEKPAKAEKPKEEKPAKAEKPKEEAPKKEKPAEEKK